MGTARRTLAVRLGPAAVLACALALAVPAPAGAADSTPFEINSAATGKCLEVADWRTDDGAPVRQWTCTGGANQKWVRTDRGEFVNVRSGKCLEIPGYSTTWGTRAGQWTCNGGLNQTWAETVVHHSGIRTLTNGHSGLLLDLTGSSTDDGTPVAQWGKNNGLNQVWFYSPWPTGSVR
ncbi:RICIN domain-containing protein [Streptomyces sp. BE20]|uniref:RICIN domain-containing protein n=1 Tax=Streptomyces sp. BE20 TaxID=3002525 RepID=UPI002E792DA7|nr:RICIN domain-containing protein [Streptomyces sp. BE20]MEE1826218.1 RICIN domain-containing protein [Streptomyces sp. BE20]